jgi:hypothetical protein
MVDRWFLARNWGAAAVLLACAWVGPAASQTPAPISSAQAAAISLENLPRPSTPPPESGPVVPTQVLRWREEAQRLEHGDGMPRDPVAAAKLYCRAARNGDAEAQFSLAWMLTNARGIARNDSEAAHLFAAAAEQGMQQAQNMLDAMGGTPVGEPPPCLRQPDTDPQPVLVAQPQRPAKLRPLSPVPPPGNAPPSIVRFVQLVAPDYGLAPELVLAVMATESNFDPVALSPKKAQGLMQVLPDTAARFKVYRLNDPAQNIRAGMAYLRWLLAYYEGDIALALAGYNAGEKAVDRYRGIPPYAETRLYVRKIIALIGGQRVHPFDATATPASPLIALWRPMTR